ncbi:MAG: hypothetical protein AAF409_05605 [Pseudomonadota bacterium]
MAGTVKIWWHDGAVTDLRYQNIPVVNEPELGFEQVLVSGTPAVTGTVPEEARVAVVETDVPVRYVVRRPGDNVLADAENSKPIAATGLATDVIGVKPGDTLSFVEVG